MSAHSKHIGFPPPLLGMEPARLPVIADDGDLLALAKPPQVLVLPDNWYPRIPVLVESIRYQAEQGKRELQRLGVPESGLHAVFAMDPDVTGVVVLTRRAETGEALRNDLGSSLCRFRFHLVAEQAPDTEETFCELPLARHYSQPRMVVSNRTGKKSWTRFRRLDRIGRFTLWEAETDLPRPHQVCIHAAECGIRVLGDPLYAASEPLYLSMIKRGYRASKRDEEETPIHPFAAVHLLEWQHRDEAAITCEPPKTFVALLRQLRRHAGR